MLNCGQELPQTTPKSTIEPTTTKDCRFDEMRDPTIKDKKNNITGLLFYCNDDQLMSSINLVEDTPYKDIGFPIITETTKFYNPENDLTSIYTIPKDFEDRRKLGTIIYDLTEANYEEINEKFPNEIPDLLTNYDFMLGSTHAYIQVLSPEQVLVAYSINIGGSRKKIKEGGVVFLGSKLSILNQFGETEYEINEDYAITYRQISPIGDFITFRTTEMVGCNKAIDGFEIHDLENDTLLYDYEFDTTAWIKEPLYLDDDLILFRIGEYPSLRELYLFDLVTKELTKKKLRPNYNFNYTKFEDEKLIFVNYREYQGWEEDEGPPTYDTLSITDFTNSE